MQGNRIQPTTDSKDNGVKLGDCKSLGTAGDNQLEAVRLELRGGEKSEFRQALKNIGTKLQGLLDSGHRIWRILGGRYQSSVRERLLLKETMQGWNGKERVL